MITRGIVVDNDESNDPDYSGYLSGRIGVIIPEIFPANFSEIKNLLQTTSDKYGNHCPVVWANASFPIHEWGIPDIGDGVYITFENNLGYPLWFGQWSTQKLGQKGEDFRIPSSINALGADAKDTKIIRHKNATIKIDKDSAITVDNTKGSVVIDKDGNITLTIADTKKLIVTSAGSATAEILGTGALPLAGTEGAATSPPTIYKENDLNSWITNIFLTHKHIETGTVTGTPTRNGVLVLTDTSVKGTTKLKGS